MERICFTYKDISSFPSNMTVSVHLSTLSKIWLSFSTLLRNLVGLPPVMAVGVLYLEEDLQARDQELKREPEASRFISG